MGDNCSDCKNWEEKIYWTHFQSVQFVQILPDPLADHLEIPKKFGENLGNKLGREVFLKVPSGAVWKVTPVWIVDALFFKMGWKQFVEDNSLQKNDILVFKYGGYSLFDVMLFDHHSLSEKEASYFVRKCGHVDLSRGCGRKETTGRKMKEEDVSPPSTDVPEHDREGSSQVRSVYSTSSPDDDATECTPLKRTEKDYDVDAVPLNCIPGNSRHRRRRTVRGNGMGSTSGFHDVQRKQFLSNRRPVTEEEKKHAQALAAKASSDHSLILVMQKYQVHRGFYLTIPVWWASEHLPQQNMDVELRVKGKAWNVRFFYRGSGGMLTTGWKNFALDNLLEEFDACLFNIAASATGIAPIVLDVNIFRVVQEAIPLTPPPRRPRSRGKNPMKGGYGRL